MNNDLLWFINYGHIQAKEIRDIYNSFKCTGTKNKNIIDAINIKISPDNIKRTYLIYNTLRYLFINQKGLDEILYNEMYEHYEDLYISAIDITVLYNSENIIDNMITFFTKPREETKEIKHKALICEEDFSDYEEDEHNDFDEI